jgi:glyoxylase I family protein
MKIEHIAFNVEDSRALADWYVAHLGMTLVRSFPDPPYIRFLADNAGETLLEVYSNPLGEVVEYGKFHPVTFHIAFTVDDMDVTRQRLVDAGGTIDGDIDNTPIGDKLAFVRDPWGNAIQLVQRKTPLMD